MALVLVIEDEPDVATVLEYNLRTAGHEPLVAECAVVGLRYARENKPDLILLDLMLPDRPGTEVCRDLKADAVTKDIPIIMLTAKAEEIDRVVGFELGADDYITKPFSVREVLLRIKRSLERRTLLDVQQNPSIGGQLRVDREAHRVYSGEDECEVSALEFRLLLALVDQQNRVLTRENLLKLVWGTNTTVCLRTVDAHVKRLRARLGTAGACVETVRGVGYRFGAGRRATRVNSDDAMTLEPTTGKGKHSGAGG
jgi:two-component system, OmpR family, phosphate regulon response regulator PhoB